MADAFSLNSAPRLSRRIAALSRGRRWSARRPRSLGRFSHQLLELDCEALIRLVHGRGLSEAQALEATAIAVARILDGEETGGEAPDLFRLRRSAEVAAAVAFLGGKAVERPDGRTLEAAVAIAAIARTLEGRTTHVLGFGEIASRLGLSLAPVFERFDIEHAVIGEGPGMTPRNRAYRRRVLFARLQDVALDLMREEAAAVGSVSALRKTIRRVAAPLASRGLVVREVLDGAIFVDGDLTLCERSLTATVATEPGMPANPFGGMQTEAIGLSAQLLPGRDYVLGDTAALLTARGRVRLTGLCRSMGEAWSDPGRAELVVSLALAARDVWLRDQDYGVSEEGLEILSDPLREQITAEEERGADLRLSNAILSEEGVEETGKPSVRARTTLRATALSYHSRAAAVAGLDIYSDELAADFGMRRAGRPLRPERLCRSEKSLVRHVRRRARKDALVILAWGSEAQATGISDALALPVDALLDRRLAPLCQSNEVEAKGACLWWPGPEANLDFLATPLLERRRVVLVMLERKALPAIPPGLSALVVALDAARDEAAGTDPTDRLLRALSWLPLPVFGKWCTSRRWRRALAQEEQPAAEIRRQLHDFDRQARRAAMFLQKTED